MIVSQPQRHLDVEDIQQFDKVIRPARRDRTGAHRVFQRQIPADDPRQQFPQGGVGVGISTSRQGDHGGELGITKTGKRASQSGEHERKCESGTRVLGSQPHHDEDAGADDGSNAQCRQLKDSQGAVQAMFACFAGFFHQQV